MNEGADHTVLRVEQATKQAGEYFDCAQATRRLFVLIVDTVLRVDFIAYTAKRALERDNLAESTGETPELPEDERTLTPGELAKSNPGPHTQELRRARQPLLELFVGRAVDNFETYVVSIIREILRKQPAILSNSKYDLEVKFILEHPTIDSLVHDLIERKVEGLSYSGFEDLADWCKKQGIPLVVPAGKLDQVIELIATRNAIAHNRGVVDQKYLAIVGSSRFKVGEVRTLGGHDLFAAMSLLNRVVDATDKLAVSSFGLDTVEVGFSEEQ